MRCDHSPLIIVMVNIARNRKDSWQRSPNENGEMDSVNDFVTSTDSQ